MWRLGNSPCHSPSRVGVPSTYVGDAHAEQSAFPAYRSGYISFRRRVQNWPSAVFSTHSQFSHTNRGISPIGSHNPLLYADETHIVSRCDLIRRRCVSPVSSKSVMLPALSRPRRTVPTESAREIGRGRSRNARVLYRERCFGLYHRDRSILARQANHLGSPANRSPCVVPPWQAQQGARKPIGSIALQRERLRGLPRALFAARIRGNLRGSWQHNY